MSGNGLKKYIDFMVDVARFSSAGLSAGSFVEMSRICR
jgi:hypothetical protein